MENTKIRNEISNLLAKYFHLHLNQELCKSDELLNFITLEGISFKQITENMILELEKEFPNTKIDKNYKYNLFERWHNFRKDDGVKSYNDTTFKLYNQVYLARIIDLRDNSLDSKAKLQYRIDRILGVGKAYGRNFTFSLFFSTENRMRETVLELLETEFGINYRQYYEIFYEQSQFYTQNGFNHFDSILKNSLKQADDLLLNILPIK